MPDFALRSKNVPVSGQLSRPRDHRGNQLAIFRISVRYQLGQELGSGATAVVYLAQDTLLGRSVALKRLHLHLLHQWEAKKRFEMEAKAVASLDHENIVRLYDVLEENGRFMLAFEYVEGGSLSDLLARAPGAMLGNLTSIAVGIQLFAALAAAHQKGIIHRDVKPSNLLITTQGVVRLTDFGLAHLADHATLTRTGHLLGTPQFMAPEQADGSLVDAKADVFSGGVVLYRCLSGRYPFQGQTAQETLLRAAKGQMTPLALTQVRLLPGLAEIVMALLARKPNDRPTAVEAVHQLRQFAIRLGLTANSNTLVEFGRDPSDFLLKETVQLSERLAQLAQQEKARGRKALSLRYATAAEEFKMPSGRQERISPKSANAKVRRRAWFMASMSAALTLLFWGLTWFVGQKGRQVTPTGGKSTQNRPGSVTTPLSLIPAIQPTMVSLASPTLSQTPAVLEPPQKSPRGMAKTRKPIPNLTVSKSKLDAAAKPKGKQEPELGFFQVWSQPPFAEVLIDEKSVGRTPLSGGLSLPRGHYRLTLRKPGYAWIDSSLFIDAHDTLRWRIRLTKLEP